MAGLAPGSAERGRLDSMMESDKRAWADYQAGRELYGNGQHKAALGRMQRARSQAVCGKTNAAIDGAVNRIRQGQAQADSLQREQEEAARRAKELDRMCRQYFADATQVANRGELEQTLRILDNAVYQGCSRAKANRIAGIAQQLRSQQLAQDLVNLGQSVGAGEGSGTQRPSQTWGSQGGGSTRRPPDVSGSWQWRVGNATGYFDLSQYGAQLSGPMLNSGTGFRGSLNGGINGRDVTLTYQDPKCVADFELHLSADGQRMSGRSSECGRGGNYKRMEAWRAGGGVSGGPHGPVQETKPCLLGVC